MPDMNLSGEIALVTGASRGIGQAIAHELGNLGAVIIGTATSDNGAIWVEYEGQISKTLYTKSN